MKFIKGLFKDTGLVDQPEGSWRHSKNILMNKVEGAICTESGTIAFSRGYTNYTAIGAIPVTDDSIVLFSVQTETGVVSGNERSAIQLIDTNFNPPTVQTVLNIGFPAYTTLAPNIDLNLKFNTEYPIEGTYKINAKGELVVYWTDDLNPARCINVTRQLKWIEDYNAGLTTIPAGISPHEYIYGVEPQITNNKNYIDRLNLFPHSGPVPHAVFTSVNSGGGLKTASYYLALAYSDVDNVQTNFLTVDGPVSIVEDSESVSPIERYDGAPPDAQTGKSITWTITNINTDYEYLRPVIIRRMGVDSEKTSDADAYESEKVFQLNDIPLAYGQQGPITLTFTGLEGYEESSSADVIVDTVAYSKVKTISQLDSILYVGNLEGSKDVGYQKYANYIKLTSRNKVLTNFDPYEPTLDNLQYAYNDTVPSVSNDRSNGYRDMMNTYKYRGYFRDEVYAFYIAFILNDGTMSYAYHIPGREAARIAVNQVAHGAPPPAPVWETDFIVAPANLVSAFSGQGKYFHFMEASDATASAWVSGNPNNNLALNEMNYWENASEQYPVSEDFEVWDADTDLTENTISGNNVFNLQGLNVRHHHFCSNRGTYPSIVALTSTPLLPATIGNDWAFYYRDIDITVPNGAPANTSTSQWDWRNVTNMQSSPNTVGRWCEAWGVPIPFTFCCAWTSCCRKSGYSYNNTPPVEQRIRCCWDYPACTLCSCTNCFKGTVKVVTPGRVHMTDLANDGGNGIPNGFGAASITPSGNCYWSSQSTTVQGVVQHTVQILGFELDDLKVPLEIADKTQGFRIYYAKRKHADKRILGQNPIIPMRRHDSELDDCHPASAGGYTEDFWAAWPFALNTDVTYPNDSYTHFTFHDFTLLRTKSSVAHATHITTEYDTNFYSFKGYGFRRKSLKSNEQCFKGEIRNNFHISAEFDRPAGDDLVTAHVKALKERCRTYLKGDTIFDGTSLGYGGLITNIEGESSIALAIEGDQDALPALGINSSNFNSSIVGSADMSYEDGGAYRLYHSNLHAFKTDMYNSIDTQDLVWTGFEVVGDDYNNFIVGQTFTNIQQAAHGPVVVSTLPADFSTSTLPGYAEGIFGGDTYLTRHGFRTTFKPTFVGWNSHLYESVHYTICESTDNINFRHMEGEDSTYFPGASALSTIKAGVILSKPHNHDSPTSDLTDKENMKYNTNYSQVNDVRPAFPLPAKYENRIETFPTRAHRSAKSDPGGLVDNFRVFLANEYKDLPKNRGELWRMLSFNNMLYFHMEDSLLKTQGKQTMQMKDGSDAFIGSGDIFAQEPLELVQTDSGYGGSRDRWAGLVTNHGYFFVDSRSTRIFLVTDSIYDVTNIGLEKWFQANIPFELKTYGMIVNPDNPTGFVGIGFHSVWDEEYQRILLTKRDKKPTTAFLAGVNKEPGESGKIEWDEDIAKFVRIELTLPLIPGNPVIEERYPIAWSDTVFFKQSGWTISFNPEHKVWVSFHDYVPSLWTYTSAKTFSFMQDGIDPDRTLWKHNHPYTPGNFYGTIYPSIFEFIDNTARDKTKLFSSLSYFADVIIGSELTALGENLTGFDSFMVYNSHQISGEIPIEYMVNTRKVDNEWKLNRFRDMAKLVDESLVTYTGPWTLSNYNITGMNVAGTVTNSVEVTDAFTYSMFEYDGMHKNINSNFIDLTKPWHKQRKFTDKFLGIRLICSNTQNNLVNLYSVTSAMREYKR